MYCYKCGNQVADNAGFCHKCGAKLSVVKNGEQKDIVADVVSPPILSSDNKIPTSPASSVSQITAPQDEQTIGIYQQAEDIRTSRHNEWQTQEVQNRPPVIEQNMRVTQRSTTTPVAVKIITSTLILIFLTFAFAYIIFLVVDMPPEEFAPLLFGNALTDEEVEAFIQTYNLEHGDTSIDRFIRVLNGDFGESFYTRRPVSDEISNKLPYTIKLMIAGIILSLVFAIPIGFVSATKYNSALDSFFSIITIICKSLPFFGVAIILVKLFSVDAGLLPAGGAETYTGYILPAITLGTAYFGHAVQAVRATMIKLHSNDYAAIFIPEDCEIDKKSFQSALLPTIAKSGIQLGWMFIGVILVEVIFSIPGLGSYFIMALQNRDQQPIIGCIMTISKCFLVTALVIGLIVTAVIYAVQAKTRTGRTV